MFFEQENIVFELLDVLFLEQTCTKIHNTGRNFDALSFRLEADTVIQMPRQQISLTSGSLAFFPSNVSYTRSSVKDRLIVIHFKSFNYHSNQIEHLYPEEPEKYRDLFLQILHTWEQKDTAYKNECAALFSRLLAELYRDYKPTCQNQKIQKSLVYMERNYLRKDFSLTAAAAESAMSDTYFRKLFKAEFGVSPKRYVIERRMDYAKALLLTGDLTVEEVADMCGYRDEKHFSVEFRKITGFPPSRYRYNFNKH